MWIIHIEGNGFRYSDVVDIDNVAEIGGFYVISGHNLEITLDKRDFVFDYRTMRGAGWLGDITITIDNVGEV